MNENLQRYQTEGFAQVEGWCADALFQTMDLMDSAPWNKSGGCAEIGVHHGKLYILLNQVIDRRATSFAIDVFERQDLNVDRSGAGSLERFRENLAKYDAHRGANTKIIQGDSTDYALGLRETIGYGQLRFLSIDGGHTAEHVLSDLTLAKDIISHEGVVIVDDAVHHHWLGVIEGIACFLMTRPTLVPFAVGHNKMYFCKTAFRDRYITLLYSLKVKIGTFFGHRLLVLN